MRHVLLLMKYHIIEIIDLVLHHHHTGQWKCKRNRIKFEIF
uniref:Uncharacterized protein n=1 Tax=Wuchereria bancrofti TaxID=6293 RepID=A0A1I8EQW9_WUCBA